MQATYHFLFEDEVARSNIYSIRILLHMHVFVCANMCEFRRRNSIEGGRM